MAPQTHDLRQALDALKAKAIAENRAGMARFGIDVSSALGVSMPNIRAVAKNITKDTGLAERLWQSAIHEARILASLVADPKTLSEEMMQRWVVDFNSWDVCDQACGNLFDKHPDALKIATEWTQRDGEFVKRAGFVIPAWHSVHMKKVADETYFPFFAIIERESRDPRNFVKKAVNWTLRQFGKRSITLHHPALQLAKKLAASDDKTARWIGRDARRELESEKVAERLGL